MRIHVVVALILVALCGCTNGDNVFTVGSPSAPLKFEKLFIMMFENHGWFQCFHNDYWIKIARNGLSLDNFYAISHPSQPNYVAQIGGDTLGCADDNNINISATNLVDFIENAGISWKAYQEDYIPLAQGNCMPDRVKGKYYRKHNPFMSFDHVRNNLTRCQKIVPATQLDIDVTNNALPQFSYYTPNIDNDAHDTDLNFAGSYLQKWLDKFMAIPNFTRNTLILITFDEDEYFENNHIYAVLLGQYITPNTTEKTQYTHYSFTRTIEKNWGLPDLGRKDKTATDFINAIKFAQPRSEEDQRAVNAPPPPLRKRDDIVMA